MLTTYNPTSATTLGVVAILLWSTTFACNRSLAEQLGPITAAASFQALGGLIGMSILLMRKKGIGYLLSFPRSYLFGCGALFVTSQTCAFIAVGLAMSRQQAIETSLIYYLWPGLTLAFSIPIFKQSARMMLLVPGFLIAFMGVALVTAPNGQLDFSNWGENISRNWEAYLLAGVGAVTWALYSNISKYFADRVEGGAVPFFLLATGITLGCVRLGINEPTIFSARAGLEVLFMGVCPMLMAYSLWDIAVRCGNLNVVASMSYLTPFFSTLASCIYLGVTPAWTLWGGCVLVVSGAVLCKTSILKEYSKTLSSMYGCRTFVEISDKAKK